MFSLKRFSSTGFASFWPLNCLFWSVLGVIVYLILNPLGPTSTFALVRTIVFTSIGFLFTSLFHFVYTRILNGTHSMLRIAAITVSFCVVFGSAWIYLLEWTTWMVYPAAAEMELLRIFGAKASLNNTFVLLAWCVSYTGVIQWGKLKEEQQRVLEKTALAREAQLQLLRYQLNPHFLFNSLNSMRRLIEENPFVARQMITQLSEFLRYSLQEVRLKYVTLSRELECVQNYLALEKIRFEEGLDIHYRIEKSAENLLVPGFLLMPLVENAVKHGASPLEIHVEAHVNGGSLQLFVRNSGSWVESSNDNGTGTGMRNLRRRLEELLPGRHRFEVGEKQGWVHASIEIELDGAATEV